VHKLKILNRKEAKRILGQLEEHFGSKIADGYVFLKNDKGRIYVVNRKFGGINTEKLRINNLGLYFGKIEKNGIRLSIEGCQIVRPKKNVLQIGRGLLDRWMQGLDIDVECGMQGFAALKYGEDFVGCGLCKDGKLLNYVPKGRRLSLGS